MSLQDIKLTSGKYVVAVSGGVDSVVLLHLLCKLSPVASRQSPEAGDGRQETGDSNFQFVVAHVDHGIRTDSADDVRFVKSLAESYGLQFESARFELGAGASEAEARRVRYKFLNFVCEKYGAQLVTAHHQDDLLETAVLNMLRGTGPYGLASMLTNHKIVRPLINTPKADIQAYAKANNLSWREDSTNQDETYLRNYIRHRLMPKISPRQKELLALIKQTAGLVEKMDYEINDFLPPAGSKIGRHVLLAADFKTLTYLMRKLLVREDVANISKPLIERVAVAAKTLPTGKRLELDGTHELHSLKNFLEITTK